MDLTFVYLALILVLAIYLGFELISKVPATLHTPLMSGANAISGITIVGALLASGGSETTTLATWLGAAAVVLATINVVGGYLVTDRMLGMFRSRTEKTDE
ncbi:MAG: NAD(P) transhydrogenase subunit alpha [Gammaproteobacteria bacterium]|nr:NAD(P) transhydrogenase subunit alpha [Gammaproteobacteria bacterium]